MNIVVTNYIDDMKHYSKVDGIIAIVFYGFDLINTYFWVVNDLGTSIRNHIGNEIYASFINIGFQNQTANNWACLVTAFPSNFLPYIMLSLILIIRKEKISSLGFQKHHNVAASLIGITAGILITLLMYSVLFFCGKPKVFSNLQRLNLSIPVLLSNILLTGLTEELSYRAYI